MHTEMLVVFFSHFLFHNSIHLFRFFFSEIEDHFKQTEKFLMNQMLNMPGLEPFENIYIAGWGVVYV